MLQLIWVLVGIWVQFHPDDTIPQDLVFATAVAIMNNWVSKKYIFVRTRKNKLNRYSHTCYQFRTRLRAYSRSFALVSQFLLEAAHGYINHDVSWIVDSRFLAEKLGVQVSRIRGAFAERKAVAAAERELVQTHSEAATARAKLAEKRFLALVGDFPTFSRHDKITTLEGYLKYSFSLSSLNAPDVCYADLTLALDDDGCMFCPQVKIIDLSDNTSVSTYSILEVLCSRDLCCIVVKYMDLFGHDGWECSQLAMNEPMYFHNGERVSERIAYLEGYPPPPVHEYICIRTEKSCIREGCGREHTVYCVSCMIKDYKTIHPEVADEPVAGKCMVCKKNCYSADNLHSGTRTPCAAIYLASLITGRNDINAVNCWKIVNEYREKLLTDADFSEYREKLLIMDPGSN
jgi:hypothetical protein